MAGTITITDNGSTLNISDGALQWDIYKSKINVESYGTTVEIHIDRRRSYLADATQFKTPSGTAAQIEAAITAMLPIT